MSFKIGANGFLKQMIRHIVSALWMVGSGKKVRDIPGNLIILRAVPRLIY
jgi:tRNA U38,U39,U40 pseudouridine synthase TruA